MPKSLYSKRRYGSEAGKWMAENGHSWGPRKQLDVDSKKQQRLRRAKETGEKVSRYDTVKAFVEAHRKHAGHDCVFVPAAKENTPSKISFYGRSITASHYMCLLTNGTPRSQGMASRHLCGNGHLSCVNPRHLVWGTPGENFSDANKHRAVGDNVQDRINSIS